MPGERKLFKRTGDHWQPVRCVLCRGMGKISRQKAVWHAKEHEARGEAHRTGMHALLEDRYAVGPLPPDRDDWPIEVLDMIRATLANILGESAMRETPPMMYPEAIESAVVRAARGEFNDRIAASHPQEPSER